MSHLLLALLLPLGLQAADPCASRKVASGVEAFVVKAPAGARDTVVRAVVCLRHGAALKVGSYHGELTFDSTAARVVGVEKPQGGMRVENTAQGGRVNFAGANPAGFAEGALLEVMLRVTPGKVPAVRLEMREINSTAGVSLLKQLKQLNTPSE